MEKCIICKKEQKSFTYKLIVWKTNYLRGNFCDTCSKKLLQIKQNDEKFKISKEQ